MLDFATSNAILNAVQQSPLWGFRLRQFAMEQLDTLPTYDWSGVYRLDGEMLRLDAYVGAHTDHTEIPVGRGVCGTAVAEDANQVIEDVRELSNYLSCSVNTRSEIVVLIRSGEQGAVSGEHGFTTAEQEPSSTPIPTHLKIGCLCGNQSQGLFPQLREGEGLLGSNPQATILGQIDIDGHQVGAFDESDEAFLTELGKILAERWNEQPV